jgi:FAD/FMN-containing dehydrogenase
VLNYQVVLANGTLLNANKDSHEDLFVALKGGGNNFGVVTRFDLQTFPQGKISTTTITYNISQRAKLFEAFTHLLDSSTYDPLASLVTTLVYSSASKAWSLKSSAVYTKPVTHPEVFDELSTIPRETIVNNITTLEVFADEEDTPPL